MKYWYLRHFLVDRVIIKNDTPEYETTIAGFHNAIDRKEVVLHHGPTIPFDVFLEDYSASGENIETILRRIEEGMR